MSKIELEKVEGVTTVFNFDSKDKDYCAFLEARNISWKTKHYKLNRMAGEIFIDFMKDYLNHVGISLRQKNSTQSYIRENNIVDIYCEKVKIIGEREKHVDCYEPSLEFFAHPEVLTVKSSLVRSGSWKLGILEDFLKLIPNGNGIERPILGCGESEGQGRIEVASIEQIPRVIEMTKKIYESIGEKRFDQLREIKSGINSFSNSFSDGEAYKILKNEYNQRLNDLLPANLF